MSTDNTTLQEQTPVVNPGNYSPVTITVNDTMGALFLGIITVMLLIGWRRAERRYQILSAQQKVTNGNNILDTQ